MTNTKSHSGLPKFWLPLTIYIFFGVLFLNLFLFAPYYWIGKDLPSSEIFVWVNRSSVNTFPVLGFGLSVFPALIVSIIFYIAGFFDSIAHRLILIFVGIIIAGLYSGFYLPISIPSGLSYSMMAALIGITGGIKHQSFLIGKPNQNSSVEINPELLMKSLHLSHNRLVIFFRESVWVMITSAIGAGSIMFVYLSNIAGPITLSVPNLGQFYQIQTIVVGGLFVYVVGGFFYWIVYALYLEMVRIENLCQQMSEITTNTS
jgi:hypothetical protein